ncbi:MAG: phosphopantothenoylcysteine decarboxylase, partial [Chlamydiota bacterium]|nr:phosphopantothenoylcysteine decarboxylase [Chlamydiota bacterium]
ISNPSSGMMGLMIAQEAMKRNFRVCLILGPGTLKVPCGIEFVKVISARDMFREVKSRYRHCDVAVMSAAVSDFRAAHSARQKIAKEDFPNELVLLPNPDILAWAGDHKKRQILVGFAAQTHAVMQKGKEKLFKKHADLIVTNRIGKNDCGFSSEWIDAAILDREGVVLPLQKMSKSNLAKKIVLEISRRISDEGSN